MNIQTNKTTLEKSTQKAPSTNINDYKQKFRVHFAEMVGYGRKTVSEGFFAGQALAEIRKRLPHGAWLEFLEDEGLNRETARKLRRLGSELEIAKIVQFASIEQAFKSLPAKTTNRNPPDPSEPTKAEEKEIEQETDRYRAERAEAEVQTARKEVARLTALSPDSAPAPPPDDNLKRAETRASETWDLLQASRKESLRRKRLLNVIKRDLADGKPAKDILLQHYGCGVRQAALGIQDRG